MKVLLVAGGGGHFAPALALIESCPEDWEIMIIGRKYTFEADKTISLEYKTAQDLGLPFQTITTGRLQRKISQHTLLSVAKIPVGLYQAIKIVQTFKPDVVVSFGGYVSVPVAFAAKMCGVPIIVHEQTMGAGLANKVVGKLADKVALSWKQSEKYFPKDKVVLTGNPLKKSFVIASKAHPVESALGVKQSQTSGDKTKKLPFIYITGGSGGAHTINMLIDECLEKLARHYRILHQTGDAKKFDDFMRLTDKKKTLPESLRDRYEVTKFVPTGDVFDVLQRADLVIARSGIGTVTQLLSLGKPSLLIPFPYGQKNEQLTNALFVKKIGIGEVAQQYSLTGDSLYALIEKMMQNLASYRSHRDDAKAAIDLQATDKLISLITHVTSKDKTTKETTES